MGMFNWVVFEMTCPLCTHSVKGFQTKDSPRKPLGCRVILPHEANTFYSTCPNCHTNIEFRDGEMITPAYEALAGVVPYAPDGRSKEAVGAMRRIDLTDRPGDEL